MLHTPGPWHWTKEYKTQDERETWSLVSEGGYGILSCDGLPNSPQHCHGANAPLLAAAPELLVACKDLVKLIDVDDHDVDSVAIKVRDLVPITRAARAAIAKAEGGGKC